MCIYAEIGTHTMRIQTKICMYVQICTNKALQTLISLSICIQIRHIPKCGRTLLEPFVELALGSLQEG